MQFASDNWSGVTPEVAAALARAGDGFAPAYGDDALTARVTGMLAEVFEHELAVLFVPTGTAANLLCLQALARPGGYVVCTEQAHLHVDELNGAELLTGMKLVPIATADGRMSPAGLDDALARSPLAGRSARVAAVSLTNATELGTVYAPDEVARLAERAHAIGAAVHLDGARFANAVAATGAFPADLTWRAGVDLMSFGGTKNGCWAAEAVVVFDPGAHPTIGDLRQRTGHTFSKQRFVAAQLEGYLTDDAWLRTAAHANAMAARLVAGLAGRLDVTLEWDSTANEVFPVLSRATAARLRAAGASFHTEQERGDDEMVRLVASFATTDDDVSAFLALL
ncbi:low specificity L-threonine aldolase [Nocardioides bigeumensis]|uniref:Low specificity L-threonine aldolase n=2 Tax=Nocardioides bigeumensis TaxID=433657 RepID=A0ABN2YZW8_9ACTN